MGDQKTAGDTDMDPIRSGNTNERIIRNGIFTLMVVGFAAYCFYDWKIGYPAANLKQAVQDLPAELQDQATINPKVTSEFAAGIDKGETFEDVEAQIGPPIWTGRRPNGNLKAIWIGAGGSMHIFLGPSGKYISQIRFQESKYSEFDLKVQLIMGVVLGALGIFLLVRLVQMLTARTMLSDEGLKLPGKQTIPFDAMTEWDITDYKLKGRITLGYNQDGQTGQVILDDYKIKDFKTIVAIICERKGFENPVDSQQAAQAASE